MSAKNVKGPFWSNCLLVANQRKRNQAIAPAGCLGADAARRSMGGRLMDIEKLIERLSKYSEPVIAYKLDADFAASITDAISELRCKCDGCSVPATTAEMIRDLNDAPKLRAENEKLRNELEQVKKKNKYSAHDVALILSDAFGDSCACNFNGNDEWLPEKCELLDTCPDVVGVACWEQYLKWLGQKED